MSNRLRYLAILFPFILETLITFKESQCQVLQTDGPELDLSDKGRNIENVISFETSKSNFEAIKDVSGNKKSVNCKMLVVNGDTLKRQKIRTRGQTTLYYRRKSYSFDLKNSASFYHGGKKEKMKKFFVLSLTMDRNYCNNRLAFEMMEKSGLFQLFYTFCELRINGQCEGIGMVVERPEDWALKKKDSPVLIRRGFNNEIDNLKAGKGIGMDRIKKYRGNFLAIYRNLNRYKGQELADVLSTTLDTDNYMKWLAFNFFIRNGDYTDEAWFYTDPDNGKFRIIPWDFDDIFSVAPHEGTEQYSKILMNKLVFSGEDALDRRIVTDGYLYKMYLEQFEKLLNELTPEVIKVVFENTYAELYPYYLNEEVISLSKYDRIKAVNQIELKSTLKKMYDQLIFSRNIYLDSITAQKR